MKTILLLSFVLWSCTDGAPDPVPDAAPESPLDPRITVTTAGAVFTGRSATLVLEATNTQFSSETTVELGDGIEVESLQVNDPTQVTLTIRVAPLTPAGVRRMVVQTGDERVAADLTLQAPLSFSTRGTVARGSVMDVEIENLDRDNPFSDDTKFVIPSGSAIRSMRIHTDYSATLSLTLTSQAASGLIGTVDSATGLESYAEPMHIVPRQPSPMVFSPSGSSPFDPLKASAELTFTQPGETLWLHIDEDQFGRHPGPRGLIKFDSSPGVSMAVLRNGRESGRLLRFFDSLYGQGVVDRGVDVLLYLDDPGATGTHSLTATAPLTRLETEDFGDYDLPPGTQVLLSTESIFLEGTVTADDADVIEIVTTQTGPLAFDVRGIGLAVELFADAELTQAIAASPPPSLPGGSRVYLRLSTTSYAVFPYSGFVYRTDM